MNTRLAIIACVAALALVGCSSKDETPEPTPPPQPAEPVELLERSRPIMSTIFKVTVAGVDRQRAEPAIDAALAEVTRLERLLSEWRPDSDISRINSAAGDHPVRVGPETLAVVKAGVNVSKWSGGAFDLSWAAMRGAYRLNPGDVRIPSATELEEKLRSINYRDIEIDEEHRTVFLKRAGMAIGTGAIAKGYALDRAGQILRRAGIENFMLFAGGQVQVHGERDGRAWRVGVQHPRDDANYFGAVEAREGSISTSGDYERFHIDDEGRRWHHIVDARTGYPASLSRSATVIAPTGLYSDALSTAAFVLGPEKAMKMFEDMPYTAELVLVGSDCKLYTTEGGFRALRLMPEVEERTLPRCEPAATAP